MPPSKENHPNLSKRWGDSGNGEGDGGGGGGYSLRFEMAASMEDHPIPHAKGGVMLAAR